MRLEFAEGRGRPVRRRRGRGPRRGGLEVDYEGEPITTAFNPPFLLDGLGALPAPTARLMFTSPNKPVVLRPVSSGDAGKLDGDYTYLIMPVRLPG